MSPSTRIDLAALVVALLAMVVSVRSCQVSQQAAERSERDYRDQRSLVVVGDFDRESRELTVRAVDPSVTLLEGAIIPPPSIHDDPLPIRGDGSVMGMGSLLFSLEQYIRQNVPQPEKDFVEVSMQGKIPIVLHSYYSAKGATFTDLSLYLLGVEFTYSGNNPAPEVWLAGVLFAERLPFDNPFDPKALDALATNPDGFYIPPRAPE